VPVYTVPKSMNSWCNYVKCEKISFHSLNSFMKP
jgi:hypothetical protein